MSYRATEASCTLTDDERLTEAHKLVEIVADQTEGMTPKERSFVEQMSEATFCSIKQLFWLRDIKDKYL